MRRRGRGPSSPVSSSSSTRLSGEAGGDSRELSIRSAGTSNNAELFNILNIKSNVFVALFDWICRQRRGSLQSEAFSEPVFQKQGKLVTFFRGFVLPRTLIGKTRRKRNVFQIDLAEHLFSVGTLGNLRIFLIFRLNYCT